VFEAVEQLLDRPVSAQRWCGRGVGARYRRGVRRGWPARTSVKAGVVFTSLQVLRRAGNQVAFEGILRRDSIEAPGKDYGVGIWADGSARLLMRTGEPAAGVDFQFFDGASTRRADLVGLTESGRALFIQRVIHASTEGRGESGGACEPIARTPAPGPRGTLLLCADLFATSTRLAGAQAAYEARN
jgi:hypothetical protein